MYEATIIECLDKLAPRIQVGTLGYLFASGEGKCINLICGSSVGQALVRAQSLTDLSLYKPFKLLLLESSGEPEHIPLRSVSLTIEPDKKNMTSRILYDSDNLMGPLGNTGMQITGNLLEQLVDLSA